MIQYFAIMSGDKYIISDKSGCYFVTFTVIHWIDIFSRREYRDIIVDSLNYCKKKGIGSLWLGDYEQSHSSNHNNKN